MNHNRPLYLKLLAFLQIILILSWLTNLQKTESYFFVCCLTACGGILSVFDNRREFENLTSGSLTRVLVLGAIFSLSGVLANYSLFEPFTSLTNLFRLMCSFLGGWSIGANVLLYLLRIKPSSSEEFGNRNHPGKVFVCSFVPIMCIDLLYLLLVEWPGVLTADSVNQISQIMYHTYNNANPLWHTATIGLFVRLGMHLTGDINVGIALFNVFQILFMAGCFSYVVMTLYQKRVPKWCLMAVWAVYALLPYQITYSVTVWKDILFSGASLLMITALCRLLVPVSKKTKQDWLLFALGGVGLCLWRTNGLLAFSMLFIALIPTGLKNRKLLAVMAAILVVCIVLCGPVLSVMGIEGSDFVEALSIPLQQIARVVYEGKSLAEEDLTLIRTIAEPEEIVQAYSSILSDPIKVLVRRSPGCSQIQENPLQYLNLWLRLGLQNPVEYGKAWVDQTKGYWNGGYSYWITATGVFENEFGIISQTQKLAGAAYSKFQRYFELMPLMHPLFSIGLHTWIAVVCCFVCRMKGRKEWILALPCLMIVLGLMIGTPVYAEFRYGYPVMLACPLLLPVTLFCGNLDEK